MISSLGWSDGAADWWVEDSPWGVSSRAERIILVISAVTLVSCSTARRFRLLCTALGKSTLNFLSSSLGKPALIFFLALPLTDYAVNASFLFWLPLLTCQ